MYKYEKKKKKPKKKKNNKKTQQNPPKKQKKKDNPTPRKTRYSEIDFIYIYLPTLNVQVFLKFSFFISFHFKNKMKYNSEDTTPDINWPDDGCNIKTETFNVGK